MYTTTIDYPGGPTILLMSCLDNSTPMPWMIAGHDATIQIRGDDPEEPMEAVIEPQRIGAAASAWSLKASAGTRPSTGRTWFRPCAIPAPNCTAPLAWDSGPTSPSRLGSDLSGTGRCTLGMRRSKRWWRLRPAPGGSVCRRGWCVHSWCSFDPSGSPYSAIRLCVPSSPYLHGRGNEIGATPNPRSCERGWPQTRQTTQTTHLGSVGGPKPNPATPKSPDSPK